MFAKIEKDTTGNIVHAYYIFDKNANPDLFPGVLVNDGIVDDLIRNNSADVLTNYYFDNDYQAVMPKPANPAIIDKATINPDGVDTATISGIPTNCVVTVGGTDYTVTDGVFEFSTNSPGVYTIVLRLFPYLQKSFEVTAG